MALSGLKLIEIQLPLKKIPEAFNQKCNYY